MIIITAILLSIQAIIIGIGLFTSSEEIEEMDWLNRSIVIYLVVTPIFALSALFNG